MMNLRIFHTNLLNNLSKKFRLMCSNASNKNHETMNTEKEKSENNKNETDPIEFNLPEEPENCCMSGCENCVWKKYAADLTDMYNDSGEKAKKIILEKIKDPSMQVFLKMELEFLDKKK